MGVDKDLLKKCANSLMFAMEDEEYDVLQAKFKVILEHIQLMNKIDGLAEKSPLTFPFILNGITLREDKIVDCLLPSELLSNTNEVVNNEVKVPKVVS